MRLSTVWKYCSCLLLATAAQIILLYFAFGGGQHWAFLLIWPGLQTMRFLPAYPGSAGSSVVFPTLPQLILALLVNNCVYLLVWMAVRRALRKKV